MTISIEEIAAAIANPTIRLQQTEEKLKQAEATIKELQVELAKLKEKKGNA